MVSIIDYTPDKDVLTITNLDAIPAGTGCKFLLVIESPYYGEYAAIRWLRKLPATIKRCQHVVRF